MQDGHEPGLDVGSKKLDILCLENKGHTFALMQPNCDFIKG
jgi:hypothetical protein